MRKVSLLGCERASLRGWMAVAVVLLALANAGCHRKAATPVAQAAPGQKTFATPVDAGNALAEAARSDSQQQMQEIFGSNSGSVLYSGDAAQDKTDMADFAKAYQQMNRWRTLDNGSQILLVGATNTGFPVPLTKDGKGQWFFDTPAGATELQVRRMGRNELAAIDICASLADAQEEYYNQDHGGQKHFARKFISDPGKDDGLYWPAVAGKPKSPVGPELAFASAQGEQVDAKRHKPFHGYYFGILVTQGFFANGGTRDYTHDGVMTKGFGFIAWPAEYGKTGVMTFMVSRDRLIFQRDLGDKTKDIAPFTTQFNPAPGWLQVED